MSWRRFVLPLLALGVAAWWFLRPDARPASAPATDARPPAAAAPAPPEDVDLSVATGALEGRVLDARGAPAPGAQVHLLAGEERLREVAADAAGRWRIANLPAGDYLLQARGAREVSAPLGPVPLAPGETLGGLDLQLEPAIFLAGTVRDEATGEGIAGAELDAAGQRAVADRAGRFRIEGLGTGPLTLRARAPGYPQRSWPLAPEGSLRGLEIFLARGATVGGRVIDGDGPVAGAAIAVRRHGLGAEAAQGGGKSGPDGSFVVDVPAGQVDLLALGPDGSSGASAPLDLAPGERLDGVEIRLEAPAALTGQVLDAGGNPAPLAAVQVASLEGAGLATATADREGRFAFERIAAGMVRVAASHRGGVGVSAPIALGPGEPAEVVVRLGGATLAGRVEDGAGRGIAGARVLAWPEGTPPAASVAATTDGDGAFSLAGLPAGPLRIEAVDGARRAEARGVQAGGVAVRLVLGDGALVGLVLVDGIPATDFTVAAAAADPGRTGGATRRVAAADGQFRLPLPPGLYEVRAGAPGAGSVRATARVPDSGDSERLVLELERGGAVEGVVRDGATGAPIGGVRISTTRSGTFAFSGAGAEPQALSGPDGTFRLTGLAPGRRHPIFAWKPGWRAGRPPVVSAAAGATERVEITLTAGGEGQTAFGGVGITLGLLRGALVAASVIEGGPGWEAGVRAGDRIVAVDGVAVDAGSMAAAVERIRGPVGTPVALDLVRGDVWFRATPLRAELRF